MIPQMNNYFVLPPLTGASPISAAEMTPYKASISEVVRRFATNSERVAILRGLLSYRKAVVDLGIIDGYMWLDGSFVEDAEVLNGRPPNDIDIVTFSVISALDSAAKYRLLTTNPAVFSSAQAKLKYRCDAYFVDLAAPPVMIVSSTCYWFGLFSHQRKTRQWKGMLQVSLLSDDKAALIALELMEQGLGGGQHA
jgi:hypothetical protein